MSRNTIETILGAVVLLAAALFVLLAYEAADLTASDGYRIEAEFGSTSGLQIGDDVRLSGIKIGQVVDQRLDNLTYTARVAMRIDPAVRLPDDSSARITAASLLGGQYLELIPGAAESYLADGDVIYDTRDPVSLTDLLGKLVFSSADQGGS